MNYWNILATYPNGGYDKLCLSDGKITLGELQYNTTIWIIKSSEKETFSPATRFFWHHLVGEKMQYQVMTIKLSAVNIEAG